MKLIKKILQLPVYTETSPNMQWDDIGVVLKTLFSPWSWKNKKYSEQFESDLKDYTKIKHVMLNDSGRTSLNLILEALNIGKGDEVILPSFTCLVVANAIRWTGAMPIYLDTKEDDYNADYSSLKEKITPRTKVILVQHTFGKIIDIEKIRKVLRELGKEDEILIIEDLAHSLKRNQELKGDVAFLTFGIEKLLSTIRGGAIVTNDDAIAQKVKNISENLREFPTKRTIIGLLNPLFWWVDVPLHKIGFKRYTLGAAVRMIWRKLGFLGIMIEKSENRSIKPDWYPARISPALARLGINQLKKLDDYNEHRSKLAAIYHKELGFLSDEAKIEDTLDSKYYFNSERIYIRYPILLRSDDEKSDVWELAKAMKITLGAWFKTPLYATYVTKEAFQKLCFAPEKTPETLRKTKTVLNLPTSVNMSEEKARKLAEELKKLLSL